MIRNLPLLLLLIPTPSVLGSQVRLQPTAPAEVLIRVVSNWGDLLDRASITLTDRAGVSHEFLLVESGDSIRIAYGDYELKAVVKGFETYRTRVRVDGPYSWLTVGLQIGAITAPASLPMVTGSLGSRLGKQGGAWVKLVGVYSDFAREAQPDKTGFFSLDAVPAGRYVLITQGSQGVLDTRVVEIRKSEHIRLE